MTRINCVPPRLLSNAHLLSEYRELPRVRHAWPRKRQPQVPPAYRMGTGHVTFFYDKGAWLLRRHKALRAEMQRREMATNIRLDLSTWPDEAMQDWAPGVDAKLTNVARLLNRVGWPR